MADDSGAEKIVAAIDSLADVVGELVERIGQLTELLEETMPDISTHMDTVSKRAIRTLNVGD